MIRVGRVCCREEMDDPNTPLAAHIGALEGLATINSVSYTTEFIASWIQKFGLFECRPISILDVGCGGGDIIIKLARSLKKLPNEVRLHGCDKSRRALQYAYENSIQNGVEINLYKHDILKGPIPYRYDLIYCNLFLHHFSDREAVQVLSYMKKASRNYVLIDDLDRSPMGNILARVAPLFLSNSSVVHADAVTSAKAAFTLDEVRHLAHLAGFRHYSAERHWPSRFLLCAEAANE